MIRVLVVDDSITVRQRLIEIIALDPELEVVGEAGDGKRAVELTAALRPDVVTLDIVMPGMSGLAATEQIMAHHPTPILIVSSSFNRGELFDTYSALAAGAVDVLEKPGLDDSGWEGRFLGTLRIVSKIRVITHPRGRLGALGRSRDAAPAAPAAPAAASHRPAVVTAARRAGVIAIGASTGGPGALAAVLEAMPAPFPIPILVLLHIDAPFAGAFADWLGTHTGHDVRLAVDGEPLERSAGRVLFGPSDVHLVIEHHRVRLTTAPPRNYCRPSIDVLFESLAQDYGDRVAACVLTGMGRDGAAGLLAIRRAGGATFAQDEATSVIYGMPREAVACGAVERELPLGEIGRALDGFRHMDRK
jgi:two-component system, chemotaxis family, protein-glutamate methylesterase/glutaminase